MKKFMYSFLVGLFLGIFLEVWSIKLFTDNENGIITYSKEVYGIGERIYSYGETIISGDSLTYVPSTSDEGEELGYDGDYTDDEYYEEEY